MLYTSTRTGDISMHYVSDGRRITSLPMPTWTRVARTVAWQHSMIVWNDTTMWQMMPACDATSCVYGTCIESYNATSCDCDMSYTGTRCDIQEATCAYSALELTPGVEYSISMMYGSTTTSYTMAPNTGSIGTGPGNISNMMGVITLGNSNNITSRTVVNITCPIGWGDMRGRTWSVRTCVNGVMDGTAIDCNRE